MKKRTILMTTIAGTLALGALGGAYAVASSGKAADDDTAEIAAVMSAKITLSDAVRRAEDETRGTAYKASMEHEDGKSVYEISTVTNNKVTELSIDPETGAVLESDGEGLIANLLRDHDELASLGDAKASLLQAIATAEQTAGGKATEAELDDDSKAPVYKVRVVPGDGKTLAVTVDGVSGQVLASGPAGDHEDDDAPDSN